MQLVMVLYDQLKPLSLCCFEQEIEQHENKYQFSRTESQTFEDNTKVTFSKSSGVSNILATSNATLP